MQITDAEEELVDDVVVSIVEGYWMIKVEEFRAIIKLR
jgi:hypothetical protein